MAFIYLSTNLYGSLQFGLCLQCSPTPPSQLQQMGPPMKALSPRSVFTSFFAQLATSSYLYNNYQVLFWGFGRFSPTAFSRL